MSNPDLNFNAVRGICFMIESGGHQTRPDHMCGDRSMCGACGARVEQNDSGCYRCGSLLVISQRVPLKVSRRAIRTWRDLGADGQALFLKAIAGKAMPMGSEGLYGGEPAHGDSDAAHERSQMGIQ